MDLSVIIVNWKSVDYLRACLRSLYGETFGINFEVIVVDNDSHDNCKEVLQEFPAVSLIAAGENLGFARANNLGYSRCHGEVLLFLNPDTEILGDDLTRMVRYLLSHPTVGAVGPRVLNSDGSWQRSCVQAFPTVWKMLVSCEHLERLFPTWRVWGNRALFDGQPPDADMVSGACLMVKRTVFEMVGWFSEEYFMYSEDLDLCYKIRQAGYAIHCLNKCQVIHHGGRSSAQLPDGFSDVLPWKAMVLFYRKTQGAWSCAVCRVAIAAIALLRLSIVLCLIPFGGARLLQGKAPRSVFRKWSRILSWALGVKKVPSASGSPAGA
jgi:hypothetical protein